MTHEIVIGYESYAELGAWREKMTQAEDWANWMKIASANRKLVNRHFLNNVKVYEHGLTLEDLGWHLKHHSCLIKKTLRSTPNLIRIL